MLNSSIADDGAGRAMAAADAQMLLLSAKMANDQFVLYAFEGEPDDLDGAIEGLRHRGKVCAELCLRVVDEDPLRYPRWVAGVIRPSQFMVHASVGEDWQGCLDQVSRLAEQQLDASQMCWRMHVFPGVHHVPGVSAAATVVVMQTTHALGDGTRSAELAGVLLGRRTPVRVVAGPDRGRFVGRAFSAALAHRSLVRDIANGRLAPPTYPLPSLSINAGHAMAGEARAALRTLPVSRAKLTGPTVTVGVLVAISEALAGYLGERGEDISRLGAEVPMAKGGSNSPIIKVHNNFSNVGVALHPELNRAQRGQRIRMQLEAHRTRSAHPAAKASDAAFAAVPAWILRWGMGKFDPMVRSTTVTGHTVVSSVNRGAADLAFGDRPVVLTAGYPALSPMMSLTHGVHGIGGQIAVSVHADSNVIDIDDYTDRMAHALARHSNAL